MPDPTPDRRVRRTRALLHRALFDLIVEKGYDQTTVQDILDRADVGRSTFYNHYATKDELLLSGLDDLRDALESSSDPHGQTLLAPLRPLFGHVEGHRHQFRAMLGRRAESLALGAGRRLLTDVIAAHLRTRLAVDDESQFDLAVTFLVDGLIGVVSWWLDTCPDLPADEVFSRFERIAARGLESLLPDGG